MLDQAHQQITWMIGLPKRESFPLFDNDNPTLPSISEAVQKNSIKEEATSILLDHLGPGIDPSAIDSAIDDAIQAAERNAGNIIGERIRLVGTCL